MRSRTSCEASSRGDGVRTVAGRLRSRLPRTSRALCLSALVATMALLGACSGDDAESPTGPPSVVPADDVREPGPDTEAPDEDVHSEEPAPEDVSEHQDAPEPDTEDVEADTVPDEDVIEPDEDTQTPPEDAVQDEDADGGSEPVLREAAEPCDSAHPCVEDMLCVRLDPTHAMGFCTPECDMLHTSCGFFGAGVHSECALDLGEGRLACGFVCVLDHGDHTHSYSCPVTNHGRMRCERTRRDQGHRYCAPPQP